MTHTSFAGAQGALLWGAPVRNGLDLSSVMRVVLAVVLAVAALLFLAVTAHRLSGGLLEAHRQRVVLEIRPLLLELLVADTPDPRGLEALAALPSGRWRVLEPTVVGMLGKVRGGALSSLVSLLAERGTLERAERRTRSRSWVRRCKAAEMLGAARQVNSLPALIPLLHDPQVEVRRVAARAVGRIGSAEAVPGLLDAAGAKLLPARDVAAALVLLEPAATPVIVGTAAEARDPRVRSVAAEVLGLRGAVEAVGLLIVLLEQDEHAEVRIRAARALGRIGVREAMVPLIAALEGDSAELRAVAARALGQLGAVDAVAALVARLYDPWHRVASNAGEALVALGISGTSALATLVASGREPANRYAEQALAVRRLGERAVTQAGG